MKPQRGWAVKLKNEILFARIGNKKECMAVYRTFACYDKEWEELKKYGYCCVKVTIKEGWE